MGGSRHSILAQRAPAGRPCRIHLASRGAPPFLRAPEGSDLSTRLALTSAEAKGQVPNPVAAVNIARRLSCSKSAKEGCGEPLPTARHQSPHSHNRSSPALLILVLTSLGDTTLTAPETQDTESNAIDVPTSEYLVCARRRALSAEQRHRLPPASHTPARTRDMPRNGCHRLTAAECSGEMRCH